MQGKKILVTGGTGLVGNGLQYALEGTEELEANTWIFASSKDCNLLNREETFAYFEKVKPTHVINLAAKVGGLFASSTNHIGFFRENLSIAMNVIEACHHFGVEKCISCMATCVFPESAPLPISEKCLHDGPPHPTNYGYSYAKRMIDVMNRGYKDKYGCNFTTVIPTNVFGRHDNFHLKLSHVIPALIHKTYIAKKEEKPLSVLGSGSPLRQFIYNVDVGKLLIWALNNYNEVEPIMFTVSEEAEVTIKEVVNTIGEAMNWKKVTFDTSVMDGVLKKTASDAKLKSLYPEFQFTPFKDAIKETCEWFVANYDTVRK